MIFREIAAEKQLTQRLAVSRSSAKAAELRGKGKVGGRKKIENGLQILETRVAVM